MSKAYLLIYIDIKKFPPTVVEFRITSEDAGNITRMGSDLIFTFHEREGIDFQDAYDKIVSDMQENAFFLNIRPYFHPEIGARLRDKMEEYIKNLPSLTAVCLGGRTE